jgi:RNA polymerase sigma-70 factor (ECF subfamily)
MRDVTTELRDQQLSTWSPRQARVVECRYFGGMSVEQTGDALGMSARTVNYHWALAKARLRRALPATDAGGSG